MLNDSISFINRQHELRQVHTIMQALGTPKVLYIHGDGGVGKTRFLQEIHQLYSAEAASFFILPIIDFDNRHISTPNSMQIWLARHLERSAFGRYQQLLMDSRTLQEMDGNLTALQDLREEMDRAFVQGLTDLCGQRRLILLFDTVDIILGTELEHYLVALNTGLRNSVMLMAGRDESKLRSRFQTQLGDQFRVIALGPLEVPACEEYIAQKTKRVYKPIEAVLAEKIVVLAKGKPILLDLAVIRINELPQTTQMLLDQDTIHDFESKLVQHLINDRTDEDRLLRLAAHVFPLDAELAAHLLEIPLSEAEKLFEGIRHYVFVKPMLDNQITLHDEMRRLILDYVWPFVPDWQQRFSTRAIDFLSKRAEAIEAQMHSLTQASSQQNLLTFGASTVLPKLC